MFTLSQPETFGLTTVAVTTISEVAAGEVATSLDPRAPARVFGFVVQESHSDHDATGSGAAAFFWAVLGTQHCQQIPGGYPMTVWPKSWTAPKSNTSTIILFIQQMQISVIVVAESRNIRLYTDILLYATIAVGISFIIKWIMKNLLKIGWLDWSPSTKMPRPSDETDCTTVAVQETGMARAI